jgi:prepilin-type processing-associated H-X9-DG protein
MFGTLDALLARSKAFTLLELLVVTTTVGILAVCLLPALAYTRPKAERLNCSNNLRQVGIAFRTWASAHGKMPTYEVPAQGGDSGNVGHRVLSGSQQTSRGVSIIFLTMSNELSTPKRLFCPAEYETTYRQAATTFAGTLAPGTSGVPYTNDLNCSYFIGVDASELSPRMLLAGDHSLGGNANPPTTPFLAAPSVGSPFLSLGTNFTAGKGPAWLAVMHSERGNVLLADGSVEWFTRPTFMAALRNTGDAGRTPGVFILATGVSAGAGCNRIQLP